MANTLAVLGGSGLYEIDGLEEVTELDIETPFGKPSDVIVRGVMPNGTVMLFLPRHGRGHRIPPHQIDYRANVCALKMAGATHLVSVSAVGSMREEIAPGHLVVTDQFIDLTKKRASTFFDDGVVAHFPFADPVCPHLAAALAEAAASTGTTVHRSGTYVCIEGPQFSTRAESRLYRSWGVSVIGMTAMPEAKLAREAELPFANLALATDYDCWRESETPVTIEEVLRTMRENVIHAKRALRVLAERLPDPALSGLGGLARSSLMTARPHVDQAARARLAWLISP